MRSRLLGAAAALATGTASIALLAAPAFLRANGLLIILAVVMLLGAALVWLPPVRSRVPVNATVPAVPAGEVAAILDRFPGCMTVKVKVAEKGQHLVDDVARGVRAGDRPAPAALSPDFLERLLGAGGTRS